MNIVFAQNDFVMILALYRKKFDHVRSRCRQAQLTGRFHSEYAYYRVPNEHEEPNHTGGERNMVAASARMSDGVPEGRSTA